MLTIKTTTIELTVMLLITTIVVIIAKASIVPAVTGMLAITATTIDKLVTIE